MSGVFSLEHPKAGPYELAIMLEEKKETLWS